MSHVIGAIDGKHVRIKCPKNTESLYCNNKGFFSPVLLAICDANYCFTLFDVGQYGSNNDRGALIHSNMRGILKITRITSHNQSQFKDVILTPYPVS